MKMERKIILKGRKISRKEIFKAKKEFHLKQANLPFEEKIKILINLQKIAAAVKGKKDFIWKI